MYWLLQLEKYGFQILRHRREFEILSPTPINVSKESRKYTYIIILFEKRNPPEPQQYIESG